MTLFNKNANVTIIILNWNGWKDTVECLESLYQIEYTNYDVILVDNNSEDNSLMNIREYCKGKIHLKSDFFKFNSKNKPINIIEYAQGRTHTIKKFDENFQDSSANRLVLIKNDENYGFAEGNNIGIRFALKFLNPDYILLLNNDTVVDKKFLNELIKIGNSNDSIGILGPTVYWYHENNKIQSAGVKLKFNLGMQKVLGLNELDIGQFKEVSSIDYVSGCALLAKSDIFSKVGYFDKDYFLYWEELDLCFRASNEGYKIVHVPKAKIWHKGSVSSTTGIKVYYMIRNCFWFMKKNTEKKQYFKFLIFFFIFLFWYRSFLLTFYYRDLERLNCYFKGIKDGLKY